MTQEDVPAAAVLQYDTFADLEYRMTGAALGPRPDLRALVEPRIRHLLATDPGGAWVAERNGELAGAALALMRERIWGLSLLVVEPSHQSAGVGRSLLENTLDYGADAEGALIVASADPRALRAYFRAGFDLRPLMDSGGPVRRRPPRDASVRVGRWPEDRGIVDAAGRFVRGAGHGRDVPAWMAVGGRLYVHESGGFAIRNGGALKVLAAREPSVAAGLLRTVLHDVPEGEKAEVEMIAAGQDWAVEVVLDAGLELRPSGALMARGDVGPLRPYLPSGAYL